MNILITEHTDHCKKIERVPYQHPGSIELALEVGKRIKDADILLLENHGVLCAGCSIQEVINKTQTFEFLSKLTVFSKSANIELKPIVKKNFTTN
ncbi:MAG: class II aldolase/adducin family protein [bacterium]